MYLKYVLVSDSQSSVVKYEQYVGQRQNVIKEYIKYWIVTGDK